jgi:hypothetical protein
MKAQTEEKENYRFVCSHKELYKVLSTIKMKETGFRGWIGAGYEFAF